MRTFLTVIAGTFAACLTIVLALACFVYSAPKYSGPASDHFDGHHFHNLVDTVHGTTTDFFKWRVARDRGPWDPWRQTKQALPPERVPHGLRVTWVNHSTMLIQIDGVNILTDPVWSERVSPVSFAGPRRHRTPGVRFEDLPPIDVVLLSHNHYDHMDIATLKRLHDQFHPRIFVALGNGAYLAKHGIPNAIEADWWEETRLSPAVRVTAVPAQHFSSRGLCDRDANLWAGWVVTTADGSVYFAGDTGWGPHFAEIGKRYAPIRLALLPIGAYLPRWFMAPVHIDPQSAIRAHHALGARRTIPMHFGTFELGDDAQDQPAAELRSVLIEEKATDEFVILDNGGVWVE